MQLCLIETHKTKGQSGKYTREDNENDDDHDFYPKERIDMDSSFRSALDETVDKSSIILESRLDDAV